MRWSWALTVLVTALMGSAVSAQAAVTLPPGFSDELVTTVASPTAFAFTPDGRMLVAAKPGSLRVVTAAGSLLPAPALNLAAKTCANRDRGLLGVAVDPAFAVNHFIYLYYTFNKLNNACPVVPAAGTPVNRVSRFTLPDSNVISAATETVLIDNVPSPGGDHNAGDLQFGKDGNLYISIGDGGCDYAGGGCAGSNDASRDENVLLGKILRITPTGAIPADNPYAQDPNAARCNTTGLTIVLARCRETFARGLRNPFRIAVDPDGAVARFYILDVGQNAWEEIDEGVAGADYGWNVREGHCANGSLTDCGTPPAGMTNPVFDYGHADGCASITGGAFVPDAAAWPASYDGTFLFGDYVCGQIFQLVPNGAGGFTRVTFAAGLSASSAVHLGFGPRGAGRALYYSTFAGGGSLRRIFHAPGNRAPTADVTALPTFGAAPLTVAFDGSASSDPDPGDTLTYVWSFGDGTTTQTPGPLTSHAYTAGGTYDAALRVRDNHGRLSAPDSVRIDVGNTPPVPVIGSPAAGRAFAVGETVDLRGTATDAQDGQLAAAALSWQVIRHHAAHTHPYLEPVAGNTASFVAPAPEDLLAATNSYIEVRLTATDSKGATATVTRDMQPQVANVSLATQPSGLTLTLDGVAFAAPRTWTSWVGWDVNVDAPDQGGGVFSSWSDGGGRSHLVRTPPGGLSATATFTTAASPPLPPPPADPTMGSATPASPVVKPAARACAPPRPSRSVRATVRGDDRGRREVTATARRRVGRDARRAYAVRLTRKCAVIASGEARGRTLVLRVKATGSKTIYRAGRPTIVRTYPRLRGSYLLQPAATGRPRITVVALTLERRAPTATAG